MTYRILPTDLHPVADAATAFLRSEWGIAPSKIVVEREFHNEVAVPTLHAVDRDHYIVAIEVSNSPYPPQLDAMVLDCSRLMLPVKLYVAMPEQGTIPQKELQRAKDNGVGVLIVNSSGCKQFERALSISLSRRRAESCFRVSKQVPEGCIRRVHDVHPGRSFEGLRSGV